ncbi:bifunctional nuclease family protein [Aestuariimicrobium sp. p3-SID1156]|uniref:bifunctional nuclease family protein n=1 Tax=Aestuariimicrobium sp. p3-SID1156 TaxID=2916038 RepID=UPI00223A6DD3|nr:bifunctional nuclease family protein [Aestuariimicrobium sp. p3-SID1156]MCT1459007.1 bifunctional nuclease family protein [Aestuariimicrobium sp. p3-SID1156]
MPKLDVIRVAMDWAGRSPMLLLREQDGPRLLAIWVGHAEARSVLTALEGHVPPRPLTHDLMAELLSELGHTALEGRITSVEEGVFNGELVVDGHVIQARPSDLAALSVRSGMTLSCPEEVLAEAGILEEAEPEDDVERFREFLDHVNPDDFEG